VKHLLIAAAITAAASQAQAQGFTYMNPTPNGGYTVFTPGSRNPYSFVNPTPNGGYTIDTPPGLPNTS
jgi:hypothetical protein